MFAPTRLIAFAALLGACALPVHAVTYCANDSETFQFVIDLAESNGQPDEIRLRVDTTYTRNASGGFVINPQDNQNLVISGGWNAGCTQRVAGTRTVIDGQFARPALQILSIGGAGQFTLRLEYLDFNNAGGSSALPAVIVQTNLNNPDNRAVVVLRNNRFFLNGTTTTNVSALSTYVQGGVQLLGNLFFANRSIGAVAQVRCDSGIVGIGNNTFVNNTTDGLTGVLQITGDCVHDIDNNLFWGNTQPDLRTGGPGQVVRMRNNNLDMRAGLAQPQLEIGTRYLDPLFAPGLINARLRDGSPMIDAGINNPPSGLPPVSLDELPRLTGLAPDIGAVEFDQILRNGFEQD